VWFRSIAIGLSLLLLGAAAEARAAVRVALLPIVVYVQEGDSQYLQKGLEEMLAARLDQYEGVVVVRASGEAAQPADGRAAREQARELQADFVLFGTFTRFGEGASLDLRCASVELPDESDDTQDTTRRVFIQSGTLAEIIPQLDVLAQKIVRYALGTSTTPRVGEVTAATAAPAAETEQVEELQRRVEALERVIYPPVATGQPDAAAAEGAQVPAEGPVVR